MPVPQAAQTAGACDHHLRIVHQQEVHAQMRRQHLLAEGIARYRHATGARQRIGQLGGQRTAALVKQGQRAGYRIRHRHEMHPQVLRQRADQGGDLLFEQPGTSQAKGSSGSWFSTCSGTMADTPSSSWPGSKR